MINQLSANSMKNFVSSYFDKIGIEYNILRVPISGADFSNRTYTYNDSPNDFNLTNFSLAYEDLSLKIPFIKAAMEISQREIKLFASSWSAPAWMKTNNDIKGKGNA
jgi:glucosylceramidase